MKKLLSLVAILLIGWYGFTSYQSHSSAGTTVPRNPIPASTLSDPEEAPSPSFVCDGRKRCPQMHSCQEAKLFLKNCPGMEMDGDGDGVPCESQWCG